MSASCANLAKQHSFVVQFKPFILDPNVPPGGIPWHDQVAMKQGEKAAKQEMKGYGPISKAGKSIVSIFFGLALVSGTCISYV